MSFGTLLLIENLIEDCFYPLGNTPFIMYEPDFNCRSSMLDEVHI
ncbi:hypothetical protein E6C60_2690 [Paenibacillus algicola]|uniref:Uncharacterized protein n=1 Tax=Paenibacillus algicola TaxID=2565926 RepID=A0A4P8XKX3_9BACL|nr:hypothetical protein E6C60_2690 [Paenibacillus algicola]